jgi:hypothetical protein
VVPIVAFVFRRLLVVRGASSSYQQYGDNGGKHNDDSSKVISAFVSAALYLTSLVLAIDLRLQKKASQLLRDAFRLATIECRSVAKAL